MLVTKIQRPKILKWKKKSINDKKKNNNKKTPASRDESMTPACAFSMNQSSVQAIHSEGKGHIPVSVACFNYSIAEVWTANTCLTTACLANNGTVAGVKSTRQITTVLLRCYQWYEEHVADFRLQSNNPIIISSSPMGKKHASRGLSFGNFYESGPWFMRPGTENPGRLWFPKEQRLE